MRQGSREGMGKGLEKFAKAVVVAAALNAPSGGMGDRAIAQEAYKKNARIAKVEHVEAKIPASLSEQIRLFEQQKTSLTDEEIRSELTQCNQLKNTRIIHLDVPVNQSLSLDQGSWLDKKLKDFVKNGEPDILTIVRVDFTRVGQELGVQSYWSPYHAMFVNQTSHDTQKRRTNIDTYLALHLVLAMRQKEMIKVNYRRTKESMGDVTFFTTLSGRGKYYDRLAKEKQGLSDFDLATLKTYEKDLIAEAKKYRLYSERRLILDKNALPHEIFHHKFDTQFAQFGYRGPSAAELLAVALKSKRERFPESSGAYGVYDIGRNIEKVTGVGIPDNNEDLLGFCEMLARRLDITKEQDYPDAELERQSVEEKLRIDLRYYLNEYLARIYAGALGSTPLKIFKELSAITKSYKQRVNLSYDIKANFHEPTPEELALLRRMEYKGRPMLPIKYPHPSP